MEGSMAYPVLKVDRERKTVKTVVEDWIVTFSLNEKGEVTILNKASLRKDRVYQSEDLHIDDSPELEKERKRAYAILSPKKKEKEGTPDSQQRELF